MKAHLLAFAIAAFTVSAAISCTQETYPETSGIEMTFTAIYEEDGDTRTVLGDNGSVLWSPGDEVSIHRLGTIIVSKFVSQNTVPAKTVEFKGFLEGLPLDPGEYYWAVYPYSEDNDLTYKGTILATLPATQTAVPGTFAEKCHPAVARSATTSLKFYAATGGLKFTVSRSDIKSVSIKGNNDEQLAGNYNVTFDDDGKPAVIGGMGGASAENEVTLVAPDGGTFTPGESYFISLLPATLSKGITITLEAIGQKGTIVSTKPQTIKRSVFGVLNNIDSKAEWQYVAETVDLGLSVEWASFNLGASKPEEYGDYFAWGETAPKAGYEWGTYKWCNGDIFSLTKYCTLSYAGNWGGSGKPDNRFLFDPEDDAARAIWGEGWRMPTEAELNELKNKCTWTWTDNYNGTGVKGYTVTGKNGNSIFLPAAGRRLDINLLGEGSTGHYWSSNNLDFGQNASSLSLTAGDVSVGSSARCVGFPVRPVRGEYLSSYYITISPKYLKIGIDEEENLNFLCSADAEDYNATDRRVFWTCSDSSVAEVSQEGYVRGKKAGTATICAYGSNGLRSSECSVTVMLKPDRVNLGLSVKWASFNVGATEPSEYGNYYAWGETEPKTSYSWNTYKWNNSSGYLTKYNWNSDSGTVDNNITLDLADDAAHAAYGDQWRTPTAAEWEELRENCTWTWVTNYNDRGTDGYLVTGKKSGYTGKSIFLPAAGSCKYSTRQDEETLGYYMSSSLDLDNPFRSSDLYFNSSLVDATSIFRYIGVPVRPVRE